MTNFEHVVTIGDCVNAGEKLREEAKQVGDRDSHIAFWDKTTELLKIVNNALETGYWKGDQYELLWQAKHLIYEAQNIAGKYARY